MDKATWRRALIVSMPMADLMPHLRAWHEAMGTRHCDDVRARLTVWWWGRTGETHYPRPNEVEAEARKAA
jgi:hypothetical protein